MSVAVAALRFELALHRHPERSAAKSNDPALLRFPIATGFFPPRRASGSFPRNDNTQMPLAEHGQRIKSDKWFLRFCLSFRPSPIGLRRGFSSRPARAGCPTLRHWRRSSTRLGRSSKRHACGFSPTVQAPARPCLQKYSAVMRLSALQARRPSTLIWLQTGHFAYSPQ